MVEHQLTGEAKQRFASNPPPSPAAWSLSRASTRDGGVSRDHDDGGGDDEGTVISMITAGSYDDHAPLSPVTPVAANTVHWSSSTYDRSCLSSVASAPRRVGSAQRSRPSPKSRRSLQSRGTAASSQSRRSLQSRGSAVSALVAEHAAHRQAMLDARSGIIANVGMQVTLHPRPRTTHTDGRSHRVRAIAAAR